MANLLDAASAVIAEVGYEATTMCAIAERAGSSIGSLYQFFPNKEAVAEALRAGYIGEVEALWESLARKCGSLNAEALVRELVQSQIAFANRHRAFVALLDAPATTNSWQRRRLIRTRIARLLTVKNPELSRVHSAEAAAVVQQMVKGILGLYAAAGTRQKAAVVREFEAAILGYLGPKLQNVSKARRSSLENGARPC